MRKLASIQQVADVYGIEGADAIECVKVQGWQIVVKKGEFQKGDLVVFYEIDSFLPASDSRYESFKERFTTWNGKEGMRLKTIKLRKALSQGLVLPVKNFPEIKNPTIDMDVTEILGIEKWENESDAKQNSVRTMGSGKTFPPFIQKTDQTRVQSIGGMVEQSLEQEFEVTMKKDGSSMTVFVVQPNSPYYKQAKEWVEVKYKRNLIERLIDKVKSFFTKDAPVIGICSRNIMLKLDDNSNFGQAVAKYDLINKAVSTGRSIALQGEVVAPDIQGNYEKVSEVEFHLFDIFDIDKQEYMLPVERYGISNNQEIPHVTIVASDRLDYILSKSKGDNVVDKCLDFAEGEGDNKGVKREGVVFKSLTSDFSFKAISNSYLLKKG